MMRDQDLCLTQPSIKMKLSRWTIPAAGAVAALMLLASGVLPGQVLAQENVRVNAVYEIGFGGMTIGEFNLNTTLAGGEYHMSAHANLSVLFGMALDWKGKTASNGVMTASGLRPAAYTLAYQANDKRESVNLGFADNSVTKVIFNPPCVTLSIR
jgi:hypothetical protein